MSRFSGLLIFLLIAGCGPQNTYQAPPPPDVIFVKPLAQPVVDYLEVTGMTQSPETVEIRSRVRGYLESVSFQEGELVRRGQVLFTIDKRPFENQLVSAQAQLSEAQSDLKEAQDSKAVSVAEADVALKQSRVDLARQENERTQKLFEKGVTNQSQYDEVVAILKSREAELASSLATLAQSRDSYETKIGSCRARVASAEAAVSKATLDLSYCEITAPITGHISHKTVGIGNLISDSGSEVLATIVQLQPLDAYVTVSETDLRRIPKAGELRQKAADYGAELLAVAKNAEPSEGAVDVFSKYITEAPAELKVQISLPSREDFAIQGVADYVDPAFDASTGTIRIRAKLDNSGASLLPGMFIRMRYQIGLLSDAILVPEKAIGTDQTGTYVYVVEDGLDPETQAPNGTRVVRRVEVDCRMLVKGTRTQDGKENVVYFRVVEGELTKDAEVIEEGLLRIRPGSVVNANESKSTFSVTTMTPG